MLENNLAESFHSHQKSNLEIMRHSLAVFLSSSWQERTFEIPNSYKRSLCVPVVGTALGNELSRIFLKPFTLPTADKISCFLDKLSLLVHIVRKTNEKKEPLARQIKDLEENLFYSKSKLLEAITVRMPADVDRRNLPL